MSRVWHRPYEPGKGRVYVVCWEAVAMAFLHWTTGRLFALDVPAQAGLGASMLALWLLGTWRIMAMGVYVGPHAVRIRGLVTTRTVLWRDIDRVVVERAGGGRWLPVPADRTVTLYMTDARRIGTTLFADGIDFHARHGEFQQVAADLRSRHAAQQDPAPAYG